MKKTDQNINQTTKKKRKTGLSSSIIKKGPKKAKPKSDVWGWQLTCALIVSLALMFWLLWALFIAGPSRLHDQQITDTYKVMEEEVPGVTGITENVFEYITYQGYTPTTLYWFDVSGKIITQRDMQTLDYNKAKEMASQLYDMNAITISLAYGYTAPVYEIVCEEGMIMLDYDTLEKVYERGLWT